MPTYEYRCNNGHTFEVIQRMADDPVSVCEACGAPVERVFHPIAVHFKGSGFYTTDYGSKAKSKASEASESKSGDAKSDDSKSDHSGSKDSASKSSDAKGSGSGEKAKASSKSTE